MGGEKHLVGINHDNEISDVNVGDESWGAQATEQVCGFHGDSAEDFAFGIDYIP